MKRKSFLICLLITFSLVLTLFAFTPLSSSALNVSDKISEVELTLPAPKTGETINRDYTTVTVKHHMSYKVVGMNWYKNDDLENKLGVDDGTDTFYKGGECYTVSVILQVKGANSGWNIEFDGTNTDYSGIHATVNGNDAIVTYHPLNPESKTINVLYEFEYIDKREITPSVSFSKPTAGNPLFKQSDITVSYPRGTFIPSLDYHWYSSSSVYDAWTSIDSEENFVAGKNYKLEFAIQAQNGFRFPIEKAFDADGEKYIYGYINGQQTWMRLYKLGYIDEAVYSDEIVYAEYCWYDCPAVQIDTVSFFGVPTPNEGQNPQYVYPTPSDSTYSIVTDDEISGGSEYGYVNGLRWSDTSNFITAQSTFENGKVYTLSFFIKSDDVFCFADFVEGSADVGWVNVTTLIENPTLALVEITFAPCNGGTLRNVSISGVTTPATGKTPDYDFTYGQGYDKGEDVSIVWVDLTDNKVLEPTDEFIYGRSYDLLVVLRSDKATDENGKFEFASLNEINITINGKEVESKNVYKQYPESKYVQCSLSFDCEKAPVETANITVENPSESKTPATQIAISGKGYKIEEFAFTDYDTGATLDKEDVFEGGKTYFFSVMVTANEGYFIDANLLNAQINGQVANVISLSESKAIIGLNLLSDELPYFFITFSAGEGATGYMNDVSVKGGTYYTLPECEFEGGEGKSFMAWSTDGTVNGIVSGEIYVDNGISLTALWENPEEHVHVYSNVYEYDELEHYKLCVSPNCPQYGDFSTKGEQMGHDWGNNTNCDTTCTVCGYVRTTNQAGEPLHFFEHPCTANCPNCGFQRENVEEHSPSKFDCINGQYCTVCGIVLVEAPGAHTPSAKETCTTPQTCTECGIELTPATGHSAGVEWIGSADGHYKLCVCGDKVEMSKHEDANKDGKCDVCEYQISTPKKGLGTGAIVGIVLGGVAVVGGGGFCLYWFVIRKKKIG